MNDQKPQVDNSAKDSSEIKVSVVEVNVGDLVYEMVLPNADTDYIQKKIKEEHRPYELRMLEDIKQRVSPSDLVLDIGANIGNHTLYLAVVADCKVVAFEPNRSLVDALLSSIELNGLAERVSVYDFGLGKEKTHGHFKQNFPENLGAQSIEVGEGDIKVVPLDSLSFEKPVKALKIDVEGMELLVLQGAVSLLREDRPILYVECQSENDFITISEFLSSLQYCYIDTFNATPTHLFQPREQLSIDDITSLLALKVGLDGYKARQELSTARSSLDAANMKYRSVSEKVDSLKKRLVQKKAKHKTVLEVNNQLQKQLDNQINVLQKVKFDWQENEQALRMALVSKTSEVAALKDIVDQTSMKCRSANENIEGLKERLAQEEAKHKTILELNNQLQKDQSDWQENEQVLQAGLVLKASEIATLKVMIDSKNQKTPLIKLQTELVSKTNEVTALKADLDQANQKYRGVTSQQVPLLKSKIETLECKVEKLAKDRAVFEQRLIKTRSSLTFQIGYQLKNAITSPKGFIRLPLALWRIYKQANKRRNQRTTKQHTSDNLKRPPGIPSKETGSVQCILPEPNETAQAISLQNLAADAAKQLKMACVMDEFTYGSYQPECNLQQLTPGNWRAELEAFQPELLFIESAWRGKDDLWGSKVGHKCQELQDIVAWCRDRSIPSVFWNKEDPVHFQTFLNTAKLFDYVFTTDIDCIHRYKGALGHDHVYLLPFACQPTVHNPIEFYQRKDAISFAGAYYVRYPERTHDLESFVSALAPFRPVEIFDRNFGKEDVNYQFPSEYQPYIVGTLPFDKIDVAYKAYRYAINLNSIKQSQSMFARRIFELLASNTITLSNYSRGLRLLLGDLVITTDNGNQLVDRLGLLVKDPELAGKLRMAALRKVMLEHTYSQRLNYVLAKVMGTDNTKQVLPTFAVFAKANTQAETNSLIDQFQAQTYTDAHLFLLVPDTFQKNDFNQITFLNMSQVDNKTLGELVDDASWLASMSPDDYYGPNYLQDIAIATRYSSAEVIGKGGYYEGVEAGLKSHKLEIAYQPLNVLLARRAAIKADLVRDEKIIDWLNQLPTRKLENTTALAIDPYNYCQNASVVDLEQVKSRVDDLRSLDTGISIHEIQRLAEEIKPVAGAINERLITPQQLAIMFVKNQTKKIDIMADDNVLHLESQLEEGKHEYVYATEDNELTDVVNDGQLKCYLDASPGLAVSLVVLFLDAQKQRISHVIFQANRNCTADIPPATAWLRFGLRVLSGGETDIKGLVLGHRDLVPVEVLGKAEHLILTNHYPAYHDLYRNGFVHSRVKAYSNKGVKVDVFRMRLTEHLSFYEFEGTDVLTGDQKALNQLLSAGRYKSILVHFLDSDMWEVLKHYVDSHKVVVWVHGSEIQPYHRREYNYSTDDERAIAIIHSEQRMQFWRALLNPMPNNLKLVFVSNYFAEEVMEDLGFRLPVDQYSIIHNPIDTNMFSYQRKPVEQRKKILSIRPYASAKYANDLSVKAILELSKKPWFSELEIRMIGDGPLFDKTLEPLRKFNNVCIERGFLTHAEIAEMHKQYGVFLCPTRMDAQGVSKDEAMSSGLVPITNRVAAIPEFIDEGCGFMAASESAEEMAESIEQLVIDHERFSLMSEAASKRVRGQTAESVIIAKELAIICE